MQEIAYVTNQVTTLVYRPVTWEEEEEIIAWETDWILKEKIYKNKKRKVSDSQEKN